MRALAPVNNGGARKVLGVGSNYNFSAELERTQTEFNICVYTLYFKCVVSYVGHCFRHGSHPISKLLSLPLAERLCSLRLRNRRMPSDNAQVAHQVLSDVGIRLGALIAGRPHVWSQSGFVFRWGEGWFEELREGGPGWRFERDDKSAVDFRVNLLLDILRPMRRS